MLDALFPGGDISVIGVCGIVAAINACWVAPYLVFCLIRDLWKGS